MSDSSCRPVRRASSQRRRAPSRPGTAARAMGHRNRGSRRSPRSRVPPRRAAGCRAPTSRTSRGTDAGRAGGRGRRVPRGVPRRRSGRRSTPCRRGGPRRGGWWCSRRRSGPGRTRRRTRHAARRTSRETPCHRVPNLDHLVTQWMSTVGVSEGRDISSCQFHRCRTPVSLRTVNSQSSRLTAGVGPADSTGNPVVSYCPGGSSRPWSRARPWNPREMTAISHHRSRKEGSAHFSGGGAARHLGGETPDGGPSGVGSRRARPPPRCGRGGRGQDVLEGGGTVRAQGADVAGQVGQGRGALGADAEDRDAELSEALLPVLGRDGADAGCRRGSARRGAPRGGGSGRGSPRRAGPPRAAPGAPRVPDPQGEGGEAVAPVAFGAVALHGGEEVRSATARGDLPGGEVDRLLPRTAPPGAPEPGTGLLLGLRRHGVGRRDSRRWRAPTAGGSGASPSTSSTGTKSTRPAVRSRTPSTRRRRPSTAWPRPADRAAALFRARQLPPVGRPILTRC